MPQLQLNQGPQDALLYDNSRSYFTNVGYVRTSNFQVEYQDVQAQTSAGFGQQVTFILPKAADLLGKVDLCVDLPAPEALNGEYADGIDPNDGYKHYSAADTSSTYPSVATFPNSRAFTAWVDEVGWAMLETVTFSVANNEIERLTGEQLQMRNELMTADESRADYWNTLKTGRSHFSSGSGQPVAQEIRNCERPGTNADLVKDQTSIPTDILKHLDKDYTRLIQYYDNTPKSRDGKQSGLKIKPYVCGARKLWIPLRFFFTDHVSQYFPMAAIAGCHEIRISIKFRNVQSLIQVYNFGTMEQTKQGTPTQFKDNKHWVMPTMNSSGTKLRLEYIHVTGPEATTLMNQEHVRLLKLVQGPIEETVTNSEKASFKKTIRLSFLHPVQELLITIRRKDDMTDTTSSGDLDAAQKGYFFYHGDGVCPNYDVVRHEYRDGLHMGHDDTIKINKIRLELNGTNRQQALSDGLENDYIRHRITPNLHSNTSFHDEHMHAMAATSKTKLWCTMHIASTTPGTVAKDTTIRFAPNTSDVFNTQVPLRTGPVPRVNQKVHIAGEFAGMSKSIIRQDAVTPLSSMRAHNAAALKHFTVANVNGNVTLAIGKINGAANQTIDVSAATQGPIDARRASWVAPTFTFTSGTTTYSVPRFMMKVTGYKKLLAKPAGGYTSEFDATKTLEQTGVQFVLRSVNLTSVTMTASQDLENAEAANNGTNIDFIQVYQMHALKDAQLNDYIVTIADETIMEYEAGNFWELAGANDDSKTYRMLPVPVASLPAGFSAVDLAPHVVTGTRGADNPPVPAYAIPDLTGSSGITVSSVVGGFTLDRAWYKCIETGYVPDAPEVQFFDVSQEGNRQDALLEQNMRGTKNIFVYPFCLNPEGPNPSGAVNFSKVSSANLVLDLERVPGMKDYLAQNAQATASTDGWSTSAEMSNFTISVYAVYYNWLQIKQGRALLSFA